jgi:hypothetical protein
MQLADVKFAAAWFFSIAMIAERILERDLGRDVRSKRPNEVLGDEVVDVDLV